MNTKNGFLLIAFVLISAITSIAQEYKVVTVVESIVPGGVGRSRLLEVKESVDYRNFTTERTVGNKSEQSEIKRDDIRIDNSEETKLLNFYSVAGINFQNIASNDAVITSKINELAKVGWQLIFVTSGVESDAGRSDGAGIFITRLILKKL